MGMGGIQDPNTLAQLIAAQNPSQGMPQTSMLNPYNYNPYQQNQMGGMGYGMMNQIMARLQNPQAMQNPMASPMFTTGAGYQSPMMQPNFNYGVNMLPIGGMASPYSFIPPEAMNTGITPTTGAQPYNPGNKKGEGSRK